MSVDDSGIASTSSSLSFTECRNAIGGDADMGCIAGEDAVGNSLGLNATWNTNKIKNINVWVKVIQE